MRRAAEAVAREHSELTPVARQSRRTLRVCTSNPVRIGRIGADHIEVFIRPASGEAELVLGVERIERLFDAGFDTIDVVFEASLEHSQRSAASGNPTIREDTT